MIGQSHAPVSLNPEKRLGTHCTEGRAGLGPGLDWHGKLAPNKARTTGHPVHSESLYRLQYSSRPVSSIIF